MYYFSVLLKSIKELFLLSAYENTTKKAGFFKSECKGNAKFANHKTFSKKNLEKEEKKKRIKKITDMEENNTLLYIGRKKTRTRVTLFG